MIKENESSSKGKQDIFEVLKPEDLNLSSEAKPSVSEKAFSQYIRALLQNWRQGTVKCKTRGEVAFSNTKPWKQKGTGRARVSSLRSPLWRKGGIIHGPQPRTRTLALSKNLRRQVHADLLWHYMDNNNVIILDWVPSSDVPKTASAFAALKNAGLSTKKINLFVNEVDALTHSSFANIANVRMLLFDQPNAYDLANGTCWVVLRKDMDAFKEMVNSWI